MQLAIFVVYGLLILGVSFGFLLFCCRRQLKPVEWIPVAPFHSSITTMFALGIIAHFAVASVHFDRPKAGFVALALLASTSTVAYTALGMIDDPHRYLDGLDPAGRLTND